VWTLLLEQDFSKGVSTIDVYHCILQGAGNNSENEHELSRDMSFKISIA